MNPRGRRINEFSKFQDSQGYKETLSEKTKRKKKNPNKQASKQKNRKADQKQGETPPHSIQYKAILCCLQRSLRKLKTATTHLKRQLFITKLTDAQAWM